MQHYLCVPSVEIEETSVQENVSQETEITEIVADEVAVEKIEVQPIAPEIAIQETEENFVETIDEVEDNPRRLALMRLLIGITISSVASNWIIAGSTKSYGLLTIGMIWVMIGIKEFLMASRSSRK